MPIHGPEARYYYGCASEWEGNGYEAYSRIARTLLAAVVHRGVFSAMAAHPRTGKNDSSRLCGGGRRFRRLLCVGSVRGGRTTSCAGAGCWRGPVFLVSVRSAPHPECRRGSLFPGPSVGSGRGPGPIRRMGSRDLECCQVALRAPSVPWHGLEAHADSWARGPVLRRRPGATSEAWCYAGASPCNLPSVPFVASFPFVPYVRGCSGARAHRL